MDGFISYPRTDNTVYPASLPIRELVSSLVHIPEFSRRGRPARRRPDATRGKKETTDHPPIYPTQADPPRCPRGTEAARLRAGRPPLPRHLRPPMITESTRADIEAGSETYFVRGSVVVDPGYAAIYTYARSSRRGDPEARGGPDARARRRSLDRRQGDPAAVADQPGQADRDDGGARTRHQGDPRRHHPEALRPRLRLRQSAEAVGDRDRDVRGVQEVRAADGDAGDDRGARGGDGPDRRRRDVQGRRRRRAAATCSTTPGRRSTRAEEDLAKVVWAGMDQDNFLGPCKVCEEAGRKQEDGSPNMLRIIRAKKAGKRFVGCRAGPSTTPTPATRPSRCPSAATSSSSRTAARSAARRRGSKSSPSAAVPGSSASTTTASRCRR